MDTLPTGARRPLTEAEALARAVEALRAAGLDDLADNKDRVEIDTFSTMRAAFDRCETDAWPAIRGAFGALFAVRAGYSVTPPGS